MQPHNEYETARIIVIRAINARARPGAFTAQEIEAATGLSHQVVWLNLQWLVENGFALRENTAPEGASLSRRHPVYYRMTQSGETALGHI